MVFLRKEVAVCTNITGVTSCFELVNKLKKCLLFEIVKVSFFPGKMMKIL